MGLFRLDEVFQIAMQAEETGRLLYETVAGQAADQKVAGLCKQLAAQERGHYEKFKAMKEAIPNTIDAKRLSVDETEFVKALVEGRVTPVEEDARRIVRENSMAKVLDMAIAAERNSVAFYGQILGGVDAGDAGAIRAIIEEEKRHERILTELRRGVKD